MSHEYGFFDLVSTPDAGHYTLISPPKDGQILATKNSWPIEFNQIDGHKAPSLAVLKVSDLALVCGGKHRLTVLADTMREHADKSAEAHGLDWDDVNTALFEASKILPSVYLKVDLKTGDWKLDEAIPAELVPYCKPAAIILATHAAGRGEADANEITAAYEAARLVPESFTAPAARPGR